MMDRCRARQFVQGAARSSIARSSRRSFGQGLPLDANALGGPESGRQAPMLGRARAGAWGGGGAVKFREMESTFMEIGFEPKPPESMTK